jgi:DNA repair exonuclease SbcCD ATPase subunit
MFIVALTALLLQRPNGTQKIEAQSPITENVWTTAWDNQPPSRDELPSAHQQAEELRSQLSQAAAEQLKATQDRNSQLEAEVSQRPSQDDLSSAQQQADELRSQLSQAAEQLKATQDRTRQLEAELSQRPSRGDLASAQQQADELRSQLSQTTEQLKASQVRTGQQEAELQEHRRAAQLSLLDRGDSLFSSGDIASARLFYERAAQTGNADAALRLGETYDPAFLKRVQPREYANSSRALFWYGRARELGATEADILLKDMQTR